MSSRAGQHESHQSQERQALKQDQERNQLSPARVILIDGTELAQLMLHHRIGVTVTERFELVELNGVFFED